MFVPILQEILSKVGENKIKVHSSSNIFQTHHKNFLILDIDMSFTY